MPSTINLRSTSICEQVGGGNANRAKLNSQLDQIRCEASYHHHKVEINEVKINSNKKDTCGIIVLFFIYEVVVALVVAVVVHTEKSPCERS